MINNAVTKLRMVLQVEMAGLHPRLQLVFGLFRFLPCATLLRLAGASVGPETVVRHGIRLTGERALMKNFVVGRECCIEPACTFDLVEPITIGDQVKLGHQVMILTSSHQIGPKEHRAGELIRAPVTIENGAWIGARSILLPGITIGEGAVINPGALVNKDVAAHTQVAGIPAKVIAQLNEPTPVVPGP